MLMTLDINTENNDIFSNNFCHFKVGIQKILKVETFHYYHFFIYKNYIHIIYTMTLVLT